MMRWAVLLGFMGLALATGLIIKSGYAEVLAALEQAGWGIVWTSLFHIVPMILCILGWEALIRRGSPGKLFFLYVLWIRAAMNNLMPVARIGGEILSVRLLMKRGMRASTAVACTVVEITLSVVAQFIFVVFGVALFVLRISDENLNMQLLWAVVFMVPVIGAFLFVQRVGFFGLMTKIFSLLFRDKWKNFAGSASRLDRAVKNMYRRKGRAFFCGVMQLASWIAGGFEIWLALYFLGHPISVLEAMMLEAVIQAASSAAFVVPGAIGVQEAGFLLFGGLLGLPPEMAAALAVVRRCRDLIIYVPGLIVWQIQEGRWFLQREAAKKRAIDAETSSGRVKSTRG